MIIGKEKILGSALAGMNVSDSLSTKKPLYRVLFLLNRFIVTPNMVKKGIGKSFFPLCNIMAAKFTRLWERCLLKLRQV